MSFQAMTWATEQKLPAMQKIVLLMLANRTNHETGICYPSIDMLVSECGMARRTLINQIKKLEDGGYITVIREKNEKKQNLVNKYKLNLHVALIGSAPDAPGVVHQMHQGSAPDAPGGSAPDAPKPVIIEPVIEPKEKQAKRKLFAPPTISEIRSFAEKENLNIDGFFDYYESNGWMVGKNKMKNWQAAARSWSRRQSTYGGGYHAKTDQQSAYLDELSRLPG